MTAPLGNVKASVPPEQLKAKMNPGDFLRRQLNFDADLPAANELILPQSVFTLCIV